MRCFFHYDDEVRIPRGLGKSFQNPEDHLPICLRSCLCFSLRHRTQPNMDTLLKRLKLEGLNEKFETEHITPDIVSKLSVHEIEMLGINSLISSLRTEPVL